MSAPCELTFSAMGGQFIYKAYPQSLYRIEELKELFQKAHQEVIRIESKFTEFKPSDLNKINDLAGIAPCPIDEEMLFLLSKSSEFFKKSHGVFDLTYASFSKRWRESLTNGQPLTSVDKELLRSNVDFNQVQIDQKAMTVFLPFPKMRIGLGGIGKGYAVDRAFEFLREKGVINFSVNGSGDMRVHSEVDAPRPWKVGIRNPFAKDPNQAAGLVQLQNGSVSTSGSYILKNKSDPSDRDHHIVTSYNDQESSPVVSSTIIGDTCLETDVWGTIAMALDTRDALALLNREEIYGILIDKAGKSHLSEKALKGFKK
ncbi:MAG: FAD:protein FMN transferase [Bacteriovoracaceae bacterium]|nr:FAD:protein FMN transferase [Bacteriovoracaceae bacterium]